MNARKILVLDTSAIVSLVQDVTTYRGVEAPGFAGVLGDTEVVVPRVVLDELDGLKRDSGERGKTAVEAARQLEQYASSGSLLQGIETEKGGLLRIAHRPPVRKVEALGLRPGVPDHEILTTAIEIDDELTANDSRQKRSSNGRDGRVVLVSQDRILRLLSKSMYDLPAEELKSVCAPEVDSEPGYRRIELSGDEIDEIISKGIFELETQPFMNEFFHLVDKDNPEVHYCYAISREPKKKQAELIDRAGIDYLKVSGNVSGRNVRQNLLLWTLMGCGEPDPMAQDGIRLVTVSGPAGSGKSFLTLAAAWERLERGHFERIVVTRPMVDVGTSLGFLPGTLEEKLQPWGGPIEDNLRAIVQVPPQENGSSKRGHARSVRPFDAKTWLEMEDRLELVPLTYIRGRTFRRSFVILEETQNIERGPLKVLLTRLGEGSFVVVIGDGSQVDNQFLSQRNNGLVHAINAFRNWPQAAHLHLRQIVRSDLAEAASELL